MPSALILGGGYAGVAAAQYLSIHAPRSWSITLVDRRPGHQLITRLPALAAGVVLPQRAQIPFPAFLDRHIQFVQAEIQRVDLPERRVVTSRQDLNGDYLICALGSRADFLEVDGAAEHGLTLKSVQDAERVRDRVERLLARQQTVRVAIVGAGYTGTEVAGEMAAWDDRLGGRRIDVTVIAQDHQLLPEGNTGLGRVAERILRAKGVQFRLGLAVREVQEAALMTSRETFPCDVVLWAAHSLAATPAGTKWPLGKDQRLRVDPYLKIAGHEHIFAAGDMALAYDFQAGHPATSSAQLAIQEGERAAANLLAAHSGRPLREFLPRQIGEALALGGEDGAADLGGLIVSRRAALAAKQAALVRYLYRLGGARLVLRYR